MLLADFRYLGLYSLTVEYLYKGFKVQGHLS